MKDSLQILGLAFDAAGILVLGVPSVFRMVQEVADQATTAWGYNIQVVHGLSGGRVDVTVGSLLLFIGFGLQIVSTLGTYYITSKSLLVSVVCLCVIITAYFLYFRGVFSRVLAGVVIRKLEKKFSEAERKSKETT